MTATETEPPPDVLQRLASARRTLQGPPREPLSPRHVALATTLSVLLAFVVWFVMFALLFSGFAERHHQTVLYAHLRENLALETVPFGGTPAHPVMKPGTPIALINSASGGIHHQVVVEGSNSAELEKGPGHLPDTVMPGQPGTSVIEGRSATFGSPFGHISHFAVGDEISITTGQGTFGYRVEDIRRPGDPFPTQLSAGQSRVVLATSSGSGWRSGWAPSRVLYVDALMNQGKLQQIPGPVPSTAAKADNPLGVDTDDVVHLFLWLQGLVLLTAGAVYVRLRWPGWGAWIVGLPVAVALLWGTTSSVMLLLPNLA